MKINKKKIACLALASALVIPGVMGLAGCEKGHTHAFNSDPFYEVVLEDGNKVARSWRECSCGAEDAHRKLDNAVIVTANEADDNYAQKVLDGNINGKTIVFDEGTYSHLEIRPTLATAKVFTKADPTSSPNEITGQTLIDSETYYYYRPIENVTFAGTAKAKLEGLFSIESGHLYGNTICGRNYTLTRGENEPNDRYDYVRNIKATFSTGVNHTYIPMNNVDFLRLNFSGSAGRIYIASSYFDVSYENISVLNCRFETTTAFTHSATSGLGAIYANYYDVKDTSNISNEMFKNFVISNNYISGHFQGIYLQNTNNLTISNNTIKNSTYNAIAVQSYCSTESDTNYYFSGNINITRNNIDNTSDRAIRFGVGKDAEILVKDNIFTNATDTDNELLKSQIMKDTTYKFINNKADGILLQDINVSNTGDNTTPWKIIIQ